MWVVTARLEHTLPFELYQGTHGNQTEFSRLGANGSVVTDLIAELREDRSFHLIAELREDRSFQLIAELREDRSFHLAELLEDRSFHLIPDSLVTSLKLADSLS